MPVRIMTWFLEAEEGTEVLKGCHSDSVLVW